DNETVKKAVLIIKNYNTQNYKEIKTEASGNITEERLIALSKIGIDYISMGELTHSVKAFDISLLIK
ncbi:MAG: nicotinate-nucleotide diphosphorylase (carboxylating), partial [Spirochaetota bacterium]